MDKDIENFFEWCEEREKCSASLYRMSDDEIRGTELYGEYQSWLLLLRDYFGIGADENDENYSQYRQIRSDADGIFKTTLLDNIWVLLCIFLVIFAGLTFSGIFD